MLQTIVPSIVRLLPAAASAALVRWLASRTQRTAVTPVQQDALASARALRFGPDGRHAAFEWGAGPLVLLAHGWNGRAAQMAPLALALSQRGFRCVAFDVTGHGSSPGRRTRWSYFIDDAAALAKTLNTEVHATVGHSAGGLALMATRSLRGLRARHHVCICAPAYPHPPIRAIRQRLNPPEPVVAAYQRVLAQQFGTTWDRLATGHAFAGAGQDLLLVYDQADRYVDHGDGDRILGWCPGAKLVKTALHGHTRILGAAELVDAIAAFITLPQRVSPPLADPASAMA